jgi:hypothetical protein
VNSLKLVTLGDASINGSVAINGNLFINKDLNVTGNLSVNQYQTKQTITTLNYQLQVVEDLSINGRLFLNGNASVTGLTTTGSVGIGTTNPTSTLHVEGNAAITGDVSFGSRLIMSTSNFTGTVSPNSTAAASATYSTSTNSTSSWSNNGVTWSSATSGSYEDSNKRYPYKAFDSNTADVGWLFGVGTGTQTNRYTGTNNTYAGTTTGTTLQNSVGATYGEWLQVQSSVPVIMKDYTLYVTDSIARHPKTYFIAGSSDNSTWYPIIKVVMTTNPGTQYLSSGTISIPSGTTASTTTTGLTYNYTYTTYGNGRTAYQYFRMIITQTSGTDGFGTALAEWNINFTPATQAITLAPSTTAYGQLDLTGGLTTTQNVGIGTNNPTAALDVNGDLRINSTLRSQGTLIISGNGSDTFYDANTHYFRHSTGTEKMRITSNGAVDIKNVLRHQGIYTYSGTTVTAAGTGDSGTVYSITGQTGYLHIMAYGPSNRYCIGYAFYAGNITAAITITTNNNNYTLKNDGNNLYFGSSFAGEVIRFTIIKYPLPGGNDTGNSTVNYGI